MTLYMKPAKVTLKVIHLLLLLLMLSFASCADANICWVCENPIDPSDRFEVCNSAAKVKWESYGYNCN
jgi:hypothetical protein